MMKPVSSLVWAVSSLVWSFCLCDTVNPALSSKLPKHVRQCRRACFVRFVRCALLVPADGVLVADGPMTCEL